MNETELEPTERQEALREWHDGYNCGMRHVACYKRQGWLIIIIAFAIGVLFGANL